MDNIERIHVDDLTVEQFIERYEVGYKPVIIRGVTKEWKANTEWQVKVRKTNSILTFYLASS